MDHRRNHRQDASAAKAGISVRSARRIERDLTLPSQRDRPRQYRTRANPFDDVWDSEIVPLLIRSPGLQAVTVLRDLQNRHPDRFPDSQLRTLQRHLRSWHALHGAERDVVFRQDHPPGQLGLSDFTVCDELAITIGGQTFPHRLYHFTLAHSQWEYAQVVEGGESFSALAVGLQNALWLLGGVPAEHRTDSLSAAYRNLDTNARDDFTVRYQQLCAHYGMRASRNNRGRSHENGSIESPHRHLKQAIDQALLLRGSRAFEERRDYQDFLAKLVAPRNARRQAAVAADRAALRPLPDRRTTDFAEATVIVASTSMFCLHGVRYSVPARLIGQRLTVHLFDDRLECFLGATAVATLPRCRRRPGKPRPYVVDYRHILASLRTKPAALRNLIWRDALFPLPAFRHAWDDLIGRGPVERACRDTIALLDLAARYGEVPVAALLDADRAAGRSPDPAALRRSLAHNAPQTIPTVTVRLPTAGQYDRLLPSFEVTP